MWHVASTVNVALRRVVELGEVADYLYFISGAHLFCS